MAHRVTLIPGDGTGPELTEATRRVLEATGVEFDWDVRHAGVDVLKEAGTPLPEETLAPTKANIMKHTDGLFLATFREVAAEYPDIEPWENLVDAVCMGLVQRPEEFDVLVLPNLYGDIISDLTAGLVGGLGVAPGANIGPDSAVFEATHGSAPRYQGQNKVNPTAMILSGKLMLEHLGEPGAAVRLEKAVADVIREGKHVTYDMKPSRDDPTAVGTSEVADAIIEKLGAN